MELGAAGVGKDGARKRVFYGWETYFTATSARIKAINEVTADIEQGRYRTKEEASEAGTARWRAAKDDTQQTTASTDQPSPVDRSGKKSEGDATAWANNYRNAKFITRAEFLKKVGPVHLLVRERSGVSDHLRNADGIVRESAAKHGFTIVPETTAIQLVVDVDVSHAKLVKTTYSNFGRSESSDSVIWTISVQIDLATTATCRRGDKFVQLMVSPYRDFDLLYGEMGNLVDFDAAYARNFRTLIDRCFDTMAKLTDADDTDNEAAWTNSLWPSAQNGEMQKKFLSAMKVEPGAPNPVFYGVTKFKPLDIQVVEDARKEFNEGSLQQSWTSELSRNGQEIDPSSDFLIRHVVGTWHLEGLFFSGPVFYVDWSSIRVYQNNVVFQFNGELRRREVCIWRALDSATALPKDNSNTARDVVNRSIRSAAREFGSSR